MPGRRNCPSISTTVVTARSYHRRNYIQSGRGTWPDDSAATDPMGTVRMPGTMRRNYDWIFDPLARSSGEHGSP